MADGLQCNGTAIYEEYKHLNRNPLFFFDTLISEDMLATEIEIEIWTENYSQDMPLRLVFSDRIINMMHQQIAANQLNDCVKMLGVPDFKTNFFPFVKQNIDLFVWCHRQGDASCTYIETMSCGVPIVGYANEAFQGIAEMSETGWVVPMN